MFTTLDIEEKRVYWRKKGNKYLVFHSTDENKEVLKICRCLEWNQKQNQRNKC